MRTSIMFLSIMFLSSLAACAGRQDKYQAQLAAQQMQITALQRMNEELRESVTDARPQQPMQEETVVYAPVPAPAQAMSAPMMAVLSVRDQQEAMMPSNVAWRKKPPSSVCAGALTLSLTNESQYHWELALNGQDVLIEGQPLVLAPQQRIWFCLPDTGEQELVGIAHLGRAHMLQETTRFVFRDSFGTWLNGNVGHHEAAITDNTPKFNQLRIYG